MNDFKFGFELETVSPLTKWELEPVLSDRGISTVVAESLFSWQRNDYVHNGQFSLVDDNSISPTDGYGVEIRSYIFEISELDKFRPLFIALKDLGITVNVRCGLHIHVSHPTKQISALDLIAETAKESVRVRSKRQSYCSWIGSVDSHYCACNQRDEKHVEFRWFNAAINFRYLCKMVRLVDFYVKKVAGNTELKNSILPGLGQPALV
jgi:hypothetical protein